MKNILGVLLLLCAFATRPSVASDLNCGQLRAAVGMIRANSLEALKRYRSKADDSYRLRVIYTFKYFEAKKNDPGATNAVFSVLPTNDLEYSVWTTMGDSLCQDETASDMRLMDSFGSRLPFLLSQAVIVQPSGMPKYIRFSLDASQDPHSNIVVDMTQVCLARHDEFKDAVAHLSFKDKKWFIGHIMQIDSCRPLALPEAD